MFKTVSLSIHPNNDTRGFVDTNLTDEPTEGSNSRSTVPFDFDNDGDLDLIVSDYGDNLFLYENISVDPYFTNEISGSWLKVKMEGIQLPTEMPLERRSNYMPIMTLSNSGFRHGSGYQSQSILPIHYGLLDAGIVDSLVVNLAHGYQRGTL